jgi:hypothetical protein
MPDGLVNDEADHLDMAFAAGDWHRSTSETTASRTRTSRLLLPIGLLVAFTANLPLLMSLFSALGDNRAQRLGHAANGRLSTRLSAA